MRPNHARAIALAATVASALAGGAAPAAAASAPACERMKGRTVAANERARVFTRGDAVYACAAGSRRRIVLEDGKDDCDTSTGCSGLGSLALAGRYVAYVEASIGRNSAGAGIYLLDLKRSREQEVWLEGGFDSGSYTTVGGLVATAGGSVAWIAVRGTSPAPAAATERRVFKSRRGAEPQLLDSGPEIELDSLAAGSRSFYWINAGAARSAPIG